MTCVNPSNLILPDSEIERTLHRRLREIGEGSSDQNIEIEDRESSIKDDKRCTLFKYER